MTRAPEYPDLVIVGDEAWTTADLERARRRREVERRYKSKPDRQVYERERHRRWREANREHYRAYQREWKRQWRAKRAAA